MTTMTVRDLQDRVDRGVRWLDKNLPDWWRADRPDRGEDGGPIVVDNLLMSHNCYCVLGQLLGNYFRADITLEDAVAFGFDSSVGSLARGDLGDIEDQMADEFDALRELWIRVIDQRRAGIDQP